MCFNLIVRVRVYLISLQFFLSPIFISIQLNRWLVTLPYTGEMRDINDAVSTETREIFRHKKEKIKLMIRLVEIWSLFFRRFFRVDVDAMDMDATHTA